MNHLKLFLIGLCVLAGILRLARGYYDREQYTSG